MESEAWRTAVHGVPKSQTRLSDLTTATDGLYIHTVFLLNNKAKLNV